MRMPHTSDIGAVLFGVVVGWVTYRTLVRTATSANVSDIATVVGAVGGAAVTGIFASKYLFGLYAIGLAVGFFGYLIIFRIANGAEKTTEVMGDGEKPVKIPD
jgi:hypothetical protein